MASMIPFAHDALADLLERIARQSNSSPSAVLEELAYRYLYESPLEALDDEQILALADLKLRDAEQEQLSSLLEAQREGRLDNSTKQELENFMQRYGVMQVRKAEAMAEAVKRGLRSAALEDWLRAKS